MIGAAVIAYCALVLNQPGRAVRSAIVTATD
jgi:hypothetical protein